MSVTDSVTAQDDPAKRDKRKRDTRNDELNKQNGIRRLIETEGGRLWIWEMLERCHIFHTSFTGNSQTFFNEGERNIGLTILADVNEADPAAFASMQKEFSDV